MADNIEERLQALRTKQSEAQRRRAQAEAKLDAVNAQKQTLLKGLAEQGYATPADAQKRVVELASETEEILAKIEAQVSGL